MEIINIAASSDHGYAQHLNVMICSLIENTKGENKVHFYIIDGGLTINDKEILQNSIDKYINAEIFFLEVNKEIYSKFSVSRHIKHASYYRISLPELLPQNVSKVLYLDCDMIIKKDIAELWDIHLNDYYIAAVSNSENIEGKYSYLGIENSCHYFNAGLLMINVNKWRQGNLTNQIIQFIKDFPEKIVYEDQDALNIFLHKKCLNLHPKWNQTHFFHINSWSQTCFCEGEFQEAKMNPAIIHYTASSKPWRYLDIHPLKNEYYNYLKLTEWREYIPPEKDILHRMSIIIFGASGNGQILIDELKNVHIKPVYIVDNDKNKWGKYLDGVQIFSPERLRLEDKLNNLIIVASDFYEEISNQLELWGYKRNKHFLIKNYEYLFEYDNFQN